MRKARKIQLDFVIDKLTNSIENRLTGEVFQTFVVPFTGNEKNYKKIQTNLVFLPVLVASLYLSLVH